MTISVPLANDGYFFARNSSVGVTNEDIEAASRCEISPERHREIEVCVDAALIHLMNAEPEGRC
jgi:hypothetical protein